MIKSYLTKKVYPGVSQITTLRRDLQRIESCSRALVRAFCCLTMSVRKLLVSDHKTLLLEVHDFGVLHRDMSALRFLVRNECAYLVTLPPDISTAL